MSKTDDYGRVFFTKNELRELLYCDEDITQLFCDDSKVVKDTNKFLEERDLLDFLLLVPDTINHTVNQEHVLRCSQWMIPDEFKNINVEEFVMSLCDNEQERLRTIKELKLYKQRDLYNMLKAMIYLVNQFIINDIVVGVGRGSSVSSFILYKIGLTKINPLDYDLNIEEFLR